MTEKCLYAEWDIHEITLAIDAQPTNWIVDLNSTADSCQSDIGVSWASGLKDVITHPLIEQNDQVQNQEKGLPWSVAGTSWKDQAACQVQRRDDGLSSN